MAFLPSGLTLWSNPPSPPQFGLPQWWGYATADTMATVAATGYFNLGGAIFPSNQTFLVGDQLYCYCSDGVASLQIATLTPNITTTASAADIPAGSITHAMLGANIVQANNIANATITTTQISATAGITFAQLAALPSADILVGSAGNVATAVAMSGDVAIANTGATTIQAGAVTGSKIAATTVAGSNLVANTVASGQLDLTTIQYVKVPMTAAQWNGMYAAPFVMIAPPGAGKMINVVRAVAAMTFVSAQYAAGGAVALQYDSTVHGAGTLASATVAAATVNAYAASSQVSLDGVVTSSAQSTTVNKGLYLSNQSGAFTTGDGTWNIHIWYEVVTL